MSKRPVCVTGLTLLLLASSSFGMRCKQALVYEGDSKYEVTQKCGDPKAKDVITETQMVYDPLGIPLGEVPYSYEIWTYQNSPNDFMYELTFEDGKVKSINAKRSGY